MGVCDFPVISALASGCLDPTQRFVDLGWHSGDAILDDTHESANDRKQGQSIISQDGGGVRMFIKGNQYYSSFKIK